MAAVLVHDLDGPGIPAYGIVEPIKRKPPKRICPFNEAVMCRDDHCERCGFNTERGQNVADTNVGNKGGKHG